MKKSLLFAFVITIVGSCIISCGSKEEERPWRYDIDYTESLDEKIGGENVTFGRSSKHNYETYEHIPNSTHCKHCGKTYSEGNHY